MRGEWRTPEREALMRAEYAAATDAAGFLARINALPGVPCAEGSTLRVWARKLGLRKTPEALATIMRDTQSRGGKTMIARLLANRRPALVWTPERRALLTERYPEEGAAALVGPLNELPGRPVGMNSIRDQVERLGLRMTFEARLRLRQNGAAATHEAVKKRRPPPPVILPAFVPEPVALEALSPDQQAAIADAAMARRQEKARAMLKKRGACPHAVAKAAGLPLREAFRLLGEVRPCTA